MIIELKASAIIEYSIIFLAKVKPWPSIKLTGNILNTKMLNTMSYEDISGKKIDIKSMPFFVSTFSMIKAAANIPAIWINLAETHNCAERFGPKPSNKFKP